MRSDKDRMIEAFYKVKSMEFVKSNRKNNTGIGKTFEDYVGVVENNLDAPDLYGFEIKSHRDDSGSYITLFTKSPNFPPKANSYLNSRYGTPYENLPGLNKLHTSMFANRYNSCSSRYSFKLVNDRRNGFVKIAVYDLDTKELIDDNAGYTYQCLERILQKKLKNLFYVSAKRDYRDGDEYFYFDSADIYTNPSLDRFLDLLDNGHIMFDIRIGSYKSGRNYGKSHDHGSCFRILEPNLRLLFEDYEKVK